jgi:Tfp pilus assembly protein PilX
MHMKARCGSLARDERGFTMLISLAVLVITMLIVGATYIAVTGDTHLSRNDLDQKRAYAAAQAGIAQYSYELNQNVNYWETCAVPPAASVPGSTDSGSTEYYSVSLLTASTSTSSSCDPNNAISTMIEGTDLSGTTTLNPAAGTFRVKSVGWSGPTGTTALASCTVGAGCVQRTIVAQFKRQSFLNFVYYTDYEVLDPVTVSPEPTDCEAHYGSRGSDCASDNLTPINFITGDTINGPMHSEDTVAVCGSPTFGRSSADAIEVAGISSEGQGNCANPTIKGTLNESANSLTPPPSNAQLLNVAQSNGQVYTGRTTIALNSGGYTVTNANVNSGAATPESYPQNGVIYVQTNSSHGCGINYTPFNPSYTSDTYCGNVYVSGTYGANLTIASDNDIIISGNLTTASPSSTLLGLVANYFVRIYHPLSGTRYNSFGSCGSSYNQSGFTPVTTIDAAILAVAHSFIVDNYDCGASLGTLNVDGAIAQLFRGPVGTGNGYNSTGYLKNYNYNDTLASIEPPYFLNPVSAAWYVQRQTECDTASTC